MDVKEFLQADRFQYDLKNHPFLKNSGQDPNFLRKIEEEVGDSGITTRFSTMVRPNYADKYPQHLYPTRALFPQQDRAYRESYLDPGMLSGIFEDERQLALIDVCSENGALAAITAYIRGKLGHGRTLCKCIDIHANVKDKVGESAVELGLDPNTVRAVRDDVRTADFKTSPDTLTYLLGLNTCDGTRHIIDRFAVGTPAYLPDHMAIQTCCHADIPETEIRSLSAEMSDDFVLNLIKQSRQERLQSDWARHQPNGVDAKSISFTVFRRIIDCLRAEKVARNRPFKARVVEMKQSLLDETGSHTLIVADKI